MILLIVVYVGPRDYVRLGGVQSKLLFHVAGWV